MYTFSLEAAPPYLAMAALSDASTFRCTACGCNLPAASFSKSQRKKALASRGDEATCVPCTEGVPRPALPTSRAAVPEDGFCLSSELRRALRVPSMSDIVCQRLAIFFAYFFFLDPGSVQLFNSSRDAVQCTSRGPRS